MNIEQVQILFQSVVSQFVAERDVAVSKINRALSEGPDNAEEIVTEQIRNLTLSKMNIANTQEELTMLMNQYKAAQENTNTVPSDGSVTGVTNSEVDPSVNEPK